MEGGREALRELVGGVRGVGGRLPSEPECYTGGWRQQLARERQLARGGTPTLLRGKVET